MEIAILHVCILIKFHYSILFILIVIFLIIIDYYLYKMVSVVLFQGMRAQQLQGPNLFAGVAMRQALHIMQLPVLDLAEWLTQEIERNPVLELKETHSPRTRKTTDYKSGFPERGLPASTSLYEHLIKQVPLACLDTRDKELAEQVIGHLNRDGFLDMPLQEVAPEEPLERLEQALAIVQSLDPPGVGGRDVRETLLLQLRIQGKEGSLAFQIVEHYFQELLHNQIPSIAKGLGVSPATVMELVRREISALDPYPGSRVASACVLVATPDVIVTCVDSVWHIDVDVSLLPRFRMVPAYAAALRQNQWGRDETAYVRKALSEGRWLCRALAKRSHTLKRLVRYLLKRQSALFAGEGVLEPMTMNEVAEGLGLHLSTVARAVAGKLLACPQGLFPLRSFFSHAVSKEHALSKRSVEERLVELIREEDKQSPLSDADLVDKLRAVGVGCARRTVSKYRSRLCIAPAAHRREWLQRG